MITVGPLGAVVSFELAAHEIRQLFVDDLDDLLGRGEAVQHIRAHSPLCYPVATKSLTTL